MAQELRQIESLPGEFVDLIAGVIADKGFKPQEYYKKVSSAAYSKGEIERNQLAKQVSDLQKELDEARSASNKPAPPAAQSHSGLAEQNEFAKQIAALKGELTSLRNEQKATQEREKQRIVTDEAKRTIAELGFEQPEAVLLLARREADFVFDPSDPNSLIAVKAGDPTQPINGPYTNTSAKDFFEAFGQTAVGMRFRPVTQAARTGAGISGVPTQAGGSGPMSQQKLSKAWEKLGVA